MDRNRFDDLTRSLPARPSRRSVLGLAILGLGTTRMAGVVGAKRKKKKNKPTLNEFGCLDVGQACGGSDARCCSGICQGRKPKKGKKDTSRCVAHNTGGCQAEQDICLTDEFPCGADGTCFRTTGKASFCGVGATDPCAVCKKDEDCQLAFGPGAACVVCAIVCPHTGGTACIAPGA